MTTGNEPTDAGAAGDDDKTSIVERPDLPTAPVSGDGSEATTISELPAAGAEPTVPQQPAPQQQQAAPDAPFGSGTTPFTQAGAPSEATTVQQQPQFGQQTPQPGPAQPQYGAPAYGPTGQPQYGAPAYGPTGQPQYGAPAYGPTGGPAPQQPQYGAPAYGPTGQPSQSQPQYGAPAYGQQQTAPGGGQPPFGGDPTLHPDLLQAAANGGRKGGGKAKLIAAIGGIVVLIAAIVLITAFVWPKWTQSSLNGDAVQSGVQSILTSPEPDGYGIADVKDISCPDGQSVEVGATFTCSVTVNGDNMHVTVTIKDSDGTYEVSRPTN